MIEELGFIDGITKMAKCSSCGKKFGVFEVSVDHEGQFFCNACFDTIKAEVELKAKHNEERKAEKLLAVEAIMLTTETAPNLNITKRIEIVTAECAFGMNIFKDLFAGVRNIVGGRSEAVQKTMRDSRRTALYELKKEAYEVGANAVVGVDLDYVELAGTGSSMVMLVASGTAVVIEGENG